MSEADPHTDLKNPLWQVHRWKMYNVALEWPIVTHVLFGFIYRTQIHN